MFCFFVCACTFVLFCTKFIATNSFQAFVDNTGILWCDTQNVSTSVTSGNGVGLARNATDSQFYVGKFDFDLSYFSNLNKNQTYSSVSDGTFTNDAIRKRVAIMDSLNNKLDIFDTNDGKIIGSYACSESYVNLEYDLKGGNIIAMYYDSQNLTENIVYLNIEDSTIVEKIIARTDSYSIEQGIRTFDYINGLFYYIGRIASDTSNYYLYEINVNDGNWTRIILKEYVANIGQCLSSVYSMARAFSDSTDFELCHLNVNNGSSFAVNGINTTQFESISVSPWSIDEGNQVLLKNGNDNGLSNVQIVSLKTGSIKYNIDFSNYTDYIATMQIESKMVCCIESGWISSDYNDNDWHDCQQHSGNSDNGEKQIILIVLSAVSAIIICIFTFCIVFFICRKSTMKRRLHTVDQSNDNSKQLNVNIQSSLLATT